MSAPHDPNQPVTDKQIGGGCRCGAVRFELTGPLLFAEHCHCESCRRTHSAPVVTWTAVPDERFLLVEGEDTLTEYRGSSHATRSFCNQCGSPVLYVSTDWQGKTYVPVAALDEPPHRQPDSHVNFEEAVPWCTMGDDLPRYRGFDSDPIPQERRRSRDEWVKMLRGAHAARAAFYVQIEALLTEEVGQDRALALIGQACRNLGLSKRERYLGYLEGDDSPEGFCHCLVEHCDVVAELFAMEQGATGEEDGKPWADVALGRCVLLDGWRAQGLEPEHIARLCRAAREIDHGTLEGVGLEGEFLELMSEGGTCCHLRVRRRDD